MKIQNKILPLLLLLSVFPSVLFGSDRENTYNTARYYIESGYPHKAAGILGRYDDEKSIRLRFIAAVKSGDLLIARELYPLETRDGELAYYTGRYHELLKEYDKATEFYTKLDNNNVFKAISHYSAGRCALASGDMAGAEKYFGSALKTERSYYEAAVALAEVKERLDKKPEALTLYKKALGQRPDYSFLKEKIEVLSKETDAGTRVPELLHTGGSGQQKPVLAAETSAASGINVRAAIITGSSSVVFRSGAPFELIFSGKKYTGEAGTTLTVKTRKGQLLFYDRKDKLVFSTMESCMMEYGSRNVLTTMGDGSMYRGNMQFLVRSGRITVVNHVDIDDYLYGVVPGEISPSWPAESLKAQAIAARTFILSRLQERKNRDYDVTFTATAYRGYSWEDVRTSRAVDQTRGTVLLTPTGRPLIAYFSHNDGGYSDEPSGIWGQNSYMVPVPDIMEKKRKEPLSPALLEDWLKNPPESSCIVNSYSSFADYRWAIHVTREDIQNLADPEHTIGYLKDIIPLERSISGRVQDVKLVGTRGEMIIPGRSARTRLGGLKSLLFICEYEHGKNGLPDYFTFIGGGWGHGFGMSQCGAAGMADKGYSAEEILRHYYPRAVYKEKYYD